MRLIARWLIDEGIEGGSLLPTRLRRLVGDTAVLGKGEIFVPATAGRVTPSGHASRANLFPLRRRRISIVEAEMALRGGRAGRRSPTEEGIPNADRRPDPCRVHGRRSDTCRDEHLYFESHGSLQRCMIEAMPAMAQWAGDHPQWRIESFHCEWADADEEKT